MKADESEVEVIQAAKRCGLNWNPWMGDWFTSYSPRNDNHNAEGTWDHWVDFALKVLSDPMTHIVRPDAYIQNPQTKEFYAQSDRILTEQELGNRFPVPTAMS